MAFDITVKIKEKDITDKVKEQKIEDFQKVFVNVASRYYAEKNLDKKRAVK